MYWQTAKTKAKDESRQTQQTIVVTPEVLEDPVLIAEMIALRALNSNGRPKRIRRQQRHTTQTSPDTITEDVINNGGFIVNGFQRRSTTITISLRKGNLHLIICISPKTATSQRKRIIQEATAHLDQILQTLKIQIESIDYFADT